MSGRSELRGWLAIVAPFGAAAVTLGFGWLEDRGLVSLGSEYGRPLLFGNAALAVAVTAVCCVLGPGRSAGRVAVAIGCGALSFAAYAATVLIGAFSFLDLGF